MKFRRVGCYFIYSLSIELLETRINVHRQSIIKKKDTVLDFTVPTSGADLRFLALQPGSAMGG